MVLRVNVCKNKFSASNIERAEMDIELLLWPLFFVMQVGFYLLLGFWGMCVTHNNSVDLDLQNWLNVTDCSNKEEKFVSGISGNSQVSMWF